jgi:hypothetical protein
MSNPASIHIDCPIVGCPTNGTVPGIRRHVTKTHGQPKDQRDETVNAHLRALGAPYTAAIRTSPTRTRGAQGTAVRSDEGHHETRLAGSAARELKANPVEAIPAHWAAHLATADLFPIARAKGLFLAKSTSRQELLAKLDERMDDVARKAAVASILAA